MRRSAWLPRIVGGACLVAAAAASSAEAIPPRLLEQARTTATELMQQIHGELLRELEVSGPQRSVIVCKYSTPEITSKISRRTGARVSRVSLRPRNPALGSADAWEQRVLLDFDARVGRGERAETLEFADIVSEPQGRFFRYMKAIPVVQACLACHGAVEAISPAVRSMISDDYPLDRGYGYSVGQVRGAVTVKIPL